MDKKPASNIAVVGCGYWGKNLVRNFAELKVLKVICDDDMRLAEKYATEYSVDAKSFDAVLNDSDIIGVAIATPAATHYNCVKKVLNVGKHVFVEKPISLHVNEAEELRRLSDEKNLTLMVGHLLQYHPIFLKLKDMVAEGTLGRLRHIYSHRLNFGKVRREENILWSFAPHDISMILSLVGSEPNKVSAIGSYYLHSEIADVTTTHLSFPGGENAHVFVSWLHPYKEQKLVVVGDEGMVVFDDTQAWENKLLLYPHKIQWKNGMPIPDKADATAISVAQGEPLKQEVQHFIDCIAGSTVCRTDSREAIRVLKVLQASEQAISQKQTISLSNDSDISLSVDDYYVHNSAVIDSGCEIGQGSKIWHFSHLLANTKIGSDCVIGQNVMIGPEVTIGDNCKVQNNVSLYKGVELQDNVFCGPSCVFTNVNNPRADIEKKNEFLKTIVKKGATIGANATIVCGVELGKNCFIAAGAVVTKSVKPFALMVGIPARQVGWVGHYGEKLDENLVCPKTGEKYVLSEAGELIQA